MADSVQSASAMNRLIHRAVLRDLRRFGAALEQHPPGDRRRADALAELFGRFDVLLTHHHEGEDTYLWPVLRGTPEDTAEVQQLSTEHDRIASALADARAAMTAFRASASAEDASTARSAVAELFAAAEEHFTHEEREIEDLLSRVEPKLLHSTVRKLGRDNGFGEAMWFMQWVADDATAEQLGFMRNTIPPPVLWMSARLAGKKYAAATAAAVR